MVTIEFRASLVHRVYTQQRPAVLTSYSLKRQAFTDFCHHYSMIYCVKSAVINNDLQVTLLFCRIIMHLQLLGLLITYFLLVVQLSSTSLSESSVSNSTVTHGAADAASAAMTTIRSGLHGNIVFLLVVVAY